MKKLLLTICSSLFCVLSYAQTEHLTFKGLPIDGSKQEFVKELQRQGYVYVDDDILSGTFIGRDSYVFIYDTPITNTVWQVHGERVMDMSYLPCGLIGVFIERCLCI